MTDPPDPADPTNRSLRTRLEPVRRVLPTAVLGRVQRVRIRARGWRQRRFDRRWGVDTAAPVAARDLDVVGPSAGPGHRYEATPAPVVGRMLRALDLDPATATFVDVGSGKGAVLLVAGRRRFRAVVGVEHAPSLHAVAEANLRRAAHRLRAGEVHSVLGDAMTFPLPAGPLVVHLCNPFDLAATGRFLDRLHEGAVVEPRPVRVLLQQPDLAVLLAERPWLRRRGGGWSWALLEVEAGSAPPLPWRADPTPVQGAPDP